MSNLYARSNDKIRDLISAQAAGHGSEEGDALNAASFILSALEDLRAGKYAEAMTAIDLAGQFARDARASYYDRTVSI